MTVVSFVVEYMDLKLEYVTRENQGCLIKQSV